MPLEIAFGETKRAIASMDYADLADLQGAVVRSFARRQATITRPSHQQEAPTNA